jgi:hypothetical protein
LFACEPLAFGTGAQGAPEFMAWPGIAEGMPGLAVLP